MGTLARGQVLRLRTRRAAPGLSLAGRGFTTAYLSLIVLVPIAAVVAHSTDGGLHGFWQAISNPSAVATLKLTFGISFIVVAVNAVTAMLIAWVLVRDSLPGEGLVHSSLALPVR